MAFTPPPVIYPARYPLGQYPLAWTGQSFVQRPDIPKYQGTDWYRPASYPMNPICYGYLSELATWLQVNDETAPATSEGKEKRLSDLKTYIPGAYWTPYGYWEPNIDWEPTSGFEGKAYGSSLSPVGFVLLGNGSILESNQGFTPALRFKNLGECSYFLTHVAGFRSTDIGKGWIETDERGSTVSQRGGTYKRRLPARLEISKPNSFSIEGIINMDGGQYKFSCMDMGSCMPMLEKYFTQYPDYWQKFSGDATGLPCLAWQENQPDDTGAIWFSADLEGPVNPNQAVWVAPCPLVIYPVPVVDTNNNRAYLMGLNNFTVSEGFREAGPGGTTHWSIKNGFCSFGRWYKILPTMYPKQHGSEYPDFSYGYQTQIEYLEKGKYSVTPVPQKLGDLDFDILLCSQADAAGNAWAAGIGSQYFSSFTWFERA